MALPKAIVSNNDSSQLSSYHDSLLLNVATTSNREEQDIAKVPNTHFKASEYIHPKERFTVVPVKVTVKYGNVCEIEGRPKERPHRRSVNNQENKLYSTVANATNDIKHHSEVTEQESVQPLLYPKLLEPPNNISLVGVPLSLASVVLPKGFSLPPSSTPNSKKATTQALNYLERVPHGVTIPPLHIMNGNHHVLNKILRDSQHSIEYGTTDGRNIKIMASRHSIGSRSASETRPGSRAEWELHPFHMQEKSDGNQDRPHWKSQLHFILSCIGACVGLGSFWRLPFLCLTCGKVAFLVPFFILLIIAGIPLLLAEITLGQLTQRGPAQAFTRICPLMQGVGLGVVIVSFLSTIYYSLIFSESILSLGIALGVPEGFCANCTQGNTASSSTLWNRSKTVTKINEPMSLSDYGPELTTDAVIAICLTLFFSWIIIYFALRKSVQTIGKVTIVSATVPFLLISAFVWRALTLPGATNGLQYFFEPEWNRLLYGEVWVNAGMQVLMSVNVVLGSSMTFASYNKFHNNVTADVWLICIGSVTSSILAVLVVFSGMGNIEFETGIDIQSFVFKGPDLAFVIYPRILSRMPQKHIWGALFFLLLLLLGLDSQFASVEVLITSLNDKKASFFKSFSPSHQMLVAGVCVMYFICSIPLVLQGNGFLSHMQGFKAISVVMLSLALCETVTFVFFYGTSRLCKHVLQITCKPVSRFYFYCWNYLTPASLLVLWIMSWVTYDPPFQDNGDIEKNVMVVGWSLAILPALPVPICAFGALWTSQAGSLREKLLHLTTPQHETCPDSCRPHNRKTILPRCFDVFKFKKREYPETATSEGISIK